MPKNKSTPGQRGFGHILMLILVALVLAIVSYAWHRVHKANYPLNQTQAATTPGQACGNQKQFFTLSPIKDADLISIIPLGNPNPPAHIFPTDHVYFFLRRSGPSPQPGLLGPAAEVPVVSPGDIQILTISAKEYLSGGPHHTDYEVDFAPCKEVQGRFDHLASLSAKPLKAFNSAKGDCQTSSPNSGTTIKFCRRNIGLALKTGEDVGTAGGTNGSNNLDFQLSDQRTPPLAFANPTRWQRGGEHVVCPVDYFSEPAKSALEKLFGDSSGTRRTTTPVCGNVAEDVKATAQGVWFSPGKPTYPEDQHVALVPDNINPAQLVFSIGQSLKDIGVSPEKYVFLPSGSGSINKDFKSVTSDGHVYCYQTSVHGLSSQFGNRTQVLLLQLINDTALRMGPGSGESCGTGPWSFTAYKDFER